MSIINLKEEIAKVLKDKIDTILSNSATGVDFKIDDIVTMLEYPPDYKMGDLALPCFKLSRALRKGPPQIAQELSNGLESSPLISRAEALNGYLNIYLNPGYFSGNVLGEILDMGDNYGSLDIGKGKTVVLDYSSPNVAKPFHIGHLGTTVIGHSLKKLHEFAGYRCIGINHLGDWGTQFGKLIVAYRLWGDKETVENDKIDALVDLYVKFHKAAEEDKDLEDKARAEFTKLEAGDEENRKLWKWFIDISIEEYKKTYSQLGIEFDYYLGESFYYDKVGPVIEQLKESGITKIDQGATIVDLEKYGMPPCLILKSDGSTIYAVRDIAAALYRKNTYDFEKCIIVTSAGQSLYFAQWFKVVELMGYDWYTKLMHVPYGTVSINGEKLATRTGNVILLKDLFKQAIEKVEGIIKEKNPDLPNKDEVAEAVGVGAIVFKYLSNSRIKDINFMLEDALSFEGDTGPYAQYTYARCCSILEKAGSIPDSAHTIECNSEELSLLKTLSRFPEVVKAALETSEPMTITRYILDICADFNRFYHECQILSSEDDKVRSFRIRLTAATKTVLGNALELICMKRTEKI